MCSRPGSEHCEAMVYWFPYVLLRCLLIGPYISGLASSSSTGSGDMP